MNTSLAQRTRFDSIDSLRGIAALWVVFYHVWNRYYPNLSTQGHSLQFIALSDLKSYISMFLFGYGYLGVNLFFVLSGLCIHLPQAKNYVNYGSDRLQLREYARRRLRRLYPAYAVSLVWTSAVLLVLPTANWLLTRKTFQPLTTMGLHDLLVSAAFLQPFSPGSLKFNGVYWTLVFELQFYILYPVLLKLCRRVGFVWPFVVLLASELFLAAWPARIECFFLSRYFEWYLGMLLAEFAFKPTGTLSSLSDRRHIWIGGTSVVTLLCGALATCSHATSWLRDIIAGCGFFGVVLFVIQSNRVQSSLARVTARLLSLKSLVLLGTFSYSLYLTHVPMIDLLWLTLRTARQHGAPITSISPVFPAILLAFCLSFGWAFYRAFELPFLANRARWRGTAVVASQPTFGG